MIKIIGPALVLRKFRVDSEPSKQEPPIVEVEGRKPGLIAFFLTLIGIDNTTTLWITRREVCFRAGSLFGEITSMVPLTAVASAHSGYAKPIGRLIAAGVVLFLSFSMAVSAPRDLPVGGGTIILIGLVIALILVISYALGKKMALYVESSGGATFGLIFKRSVIEGVAVDIDRVKAVVDLIRELVIAAQHRSAA